MSLKSTPNSGRAYRKALACWGAVRTGPRVVWSPKDSRCHRTLAHDRKFQTHWTVSWLGRGFDCERTFGMAPRWADETNDHTGVLERSMYSLKKKRE